MAEDLKRYLSHEPIRARRPAVAERAAKWARRHRPLVCSGLVFLVLSAIGLAASTLLIAREQTKTAAAYQGEKDQRQIAQQKEQAALEAAQRERQAKSQSEGHRKQAEANLQRAMDAVDQMLAEVGDKELENIPQMEQVRRSLLQRALAFYTVFLAENSQNPSVRQESARAYRRTGNIQALLRKIRRRRRHTTKRSRSSSP